MTLASGMYPGTAYAHSWFATMVKSFVRDGYVKDYGGELEVIASVPPAMSVSVDTGRARVQGYWYENDADKSMAITASDPVNPRIDRIVLRLTPTAPPRQIVLAVLTGVAGAIPAAPTLTQDGTTWEISLAQIAVAAAAASITAANITDERDDYTLCGQASTAAVYVGDLITPTADIDMGGMKITDLPAPSGATDIARKAYYDTAIPGTLGVNKFEIVPVYGAVPAGWLECNGQAVAQATYPELWAAWGTTFGASGGNVVLPDLRGRMIYGAGATIGTKSGAKTVTLTTDQTGHTHTGAWPGTAVTCFNQNEAGSYHGGANVTDTLDPQGGAGAHNNLSPYMALRFIVRGS